MALAALAESTAERLSTQTGATSKTTVWEIARLLQCAVLEVGPKLVGDGFSVRSMRLIGWKPSGYAPRDAFTLGHELGHIECPAEVPSDYEEAFCDRVAAGLILPRRRFLKAIKGHGLDIPRLRRANHWASYAAIARRVVDLVPNSEVSIWENGVAKFEACHVSSEPSLEANVAHGLAVHEAMGKAGRATVRHSGVEATAWRLGGGRVRRALVVSVAS